MSHNDWIFLRGLARENAHWGDFPAQFAQSLPGVALHAIDLPGNGQYWRAPSPLSLREMAACVRAQARQRLGHSQPCHVLAVSLGGMLALEWLRQQPEEIAGAVLINTSLKKLNPLHQRLSWRAWPELLAIALRRDDRARERAILALTSQRPIDAWRVEAHALAYQRHPISHANLLRQLWAAASYCPPLALPPVPVLLLNSLGDRMVAPACSQALAQHFGLPLKTHPWAGHDLPLDDPAWTIQAVADWLDERKVLPIGLSRSKGCA
jgi:pimeloyl-ACP methyl ester carboxylesterase